MKKQKLIFKGPLAEVIKRVITDHFNQVISSEPSVENREIEEEGSSISVVRDKEEGSRIVVEAEKTYNTIIIYGVAAASIEAIHAAEFIDTLYLIKDTTKLILFIMDDSEDNGEPSKYSEVIIRASALTNANLYTSLDTLVEDLIS